MTLGPPRSLGNLEAMQQRRCSQPWQMVLSTTTELFTFTVDVTEYVQPLITLVAEHTADTESRPPLVKRRPCWIVCILLLYLIVFTFHARSKCRWVSLEHFIAVGFSTILNSVVLVHWGDVRMCVCLSVKDVLDKNRKTSNRRSFFHHVCSHRLCSAYLFTPEGRGPYRPAQGYLHLLGLRFLVSVVSRLMFLILLVHLHFVLTHSNRRTDIIPTVNHIDTTHYSLCLWILWTFPHLRSQSDNNRTCIYKVETLCWLSFCR